MCVVCKPFVVPGRCGSCEVFQSEVNMSRSERAYSHSLVRCGLDRCLVLSCPSPLYIRHIYSRGKSESPSPNPPSHHMAPHATTSVQPKVALNDVENIRIEKNAAYVNKG